MVNKKLHIQIATESGGSQTLIIRKHTLRNCLLAAAAATTLLITGSLLGAKYFKDNQELSKEIAYLTAKLHHAVPDVNDDQQTQIDTLRKQLLLTKTELTVRAKRKADLVRQYEQQINQLKQQQKELVAVSVNRLNERAKSIESVMSKLGVEVKVKEDPKHSGGLFVAPPAKGNGEKLLKETETYLNTLENMPLGRPLTTEISSTFGRRSDPLNQKQAFHEGLDFRGNIGDPVAATGNATVVESGFAADYGNCILLSHGNGIESFYAHLSKRLVEQGQRITSGQKIGLVGKTGRSTGAHLHYEVRHKGKAIDPMRFIQVAQQSKALKKRVQ